MERVPWVVLLLLNFSFTVATPFAAVSAAAWTVATIVDRTLNTARANAPAGAERDASAVLTRALDMLVIGCVLIAAFGARGLPPVFFGAWVVLQILTSLYYLRVPVAQTVLNPIFIMQFLLFAVYVVIAFINFWSAFAAIAFAPPPLRLRFDITVRVLMAIASVFGVAFSMTSVSEYVVLGVLIVLVLTSVVIETSITRAGQWTSAAGAS